MGLTNFPNGVRSFGIPLIGSGPILTTGEVFFVHAGTGGANNGGTDPDRPLNSIDNAINKCTATSSSYGSQDLIIVLPGHAETISAAAGFDADQAGVQIVGLGSGPNRPTLTLGTAAGADTDLAADGVSITNLLYVAALDSISSLVDVNADGVKVMNCEFRDASNVGIDDTVDIADSDDLLIQNCRFYETDTGVGQSAILGTTPTRLTIQGCDFLKDAQTGVIELGNAVDVRVLDNYIESLAPEDLAIVTGSTATGWIDGNYIRLADDAANITECITEDTDCQIGRNWVVNADAERVLEYNTTATVDEA